MLNFMGIWICMISDLFCLVNCHWYAQIYRVVSSNNLDSWNFINHGIAYNVSNESGITIISSDLYGERGIGYFVNANVGTPPQKVKLLIDTGSSNSAIAGPNFPQIDMHFQPAASSTFSSMNVSVTLKYDMGSWNGHLSCDVISLDGAYYKRINNSTTVKIAPMPFRTRFSVIDNARNFFKSGDSVWSGILGLAFPLLTLPPSLSDKSTLLDDLTRQLGLNNCFSVALCGLGNNRMSTHVTGHFIMGGSNSSLYKGQLVYVPGRRRMYYEVLISRLSVLGNPVATSSCMEYNLYKTILDTGTSLTLFSRPVYNGLVSLIRRAAQPRLPSLSPSSSNKAYSLFWAGSALLCLPVIRGIHVSLMSLFPDVEIDLVINDTSSVRLALSPQNYLTFVGAQTDFFGNQRFCYRLGFGISDVGTTLGVTFMEGFFFVFDRSHNKIGIAQSSCNSHTANNKRSRIVRIRTNQKSLLSCAFMKPLTLLDFITYSFPLTFCILFMAFLIPFIFVLMCFQYRNMPSSDTYHSGSAGIFTTQTQYQSMDRSN